MVGDNIKGDLKPYHGSNGTSLVGCFLEDLQLMTCLHALNCHHHGWADYCFNQGAYADLERAHLEPICWSDMVKFWRMVLEDAYGMGGMKAWSEHTDHELRRKLAHVWSDNVQNFPDANANDVSPACRSDANATKCSAPALPGRLEKMSTLHGKHLFCLMMAKTFAST